MILEPEYLDRIYSQWLIEDQQQQDPDTPPMTMQERIQAARKKQLDNGLTSCYTREETNKA